MMREKEIEKSVLRIGKMENLFHLLTEILRNRPDALQLASTQRAIQVLSDYYENGDWLHDYELDEQQLLPSTLKRGVLSQDGLYNFLCEIQKNTIES